MIMLVTAVNLSGGWPITTVSIAASCEGGLCAALIILFHVLGGVGLIASVAVLLLWRKDYQNWKEHIEITRSSGAAS